MSGTEVVLALERVTKSFNLKAAAVTALQEVSVEVLRGERVALLGANGAGKTTCMDMVCGVTHPTSGRIRVLDTSPRRAVQEGRLTAVLQTGGLLRDLTVRETVHVIAALHRLPERTEVVLQQAGLTGVAKRLVGRCSGGEQQRLKFALALIPDPEVMVLDEPASGLDQEGRAALWEQLRERSSRGTTILHSTHHLEEIDDLVDRVLWLRQGRLVADLRVSDLTGRGAARTITAQLPGPGATSRAVQELSRPEQVRNHGSVGSQVRLVAGSRFSDTVVSRLLRDFAATEILVAPLTLQAALVEMVGEEG